MSSRSVDIQKATNPARCYTGFAFFLRCRQLLHGSDFHRIDAGRDFGTTPRERSAMPRDRVLGASCWNCRADPDRTRSLRRQQLGATPMSALPDVSLRMLHSDAGAISTIGRHCRRQSQPPGGCSSEVEKNLRLHFRTQPDERGGRRFCMAGRILRPGGWRLHRTLFSRQMIPLHDSVM